MGEIIRSVFGEETYFERIKDSKNPIKIRLRMLEYLHQCQSVSETARRFGVSRQIIRKWEKRFEEQGIDGLKDRPKTPKKKRNVINEEIKDLILKIKNEHQEYGPRRIKNILKELYNVNISEHPIYNLLKSTGLVKVGNHHK